MKWFTRKEEKGQQFEQVLERILMAQGGVPGAGVTPDNCMSSPTVHAVCTAVSRRFAATPLHVYQKTTEGGQEVKKKRPDHPVARVLRSPNEWQTSADFFEDAASVYVRWGNFYSYKSQDRTGKIHALVPLPPKDVTPTLKDNTDFFYKVNQGGETIEEKASKIFHARGAARNFIEGDSPIKDIRVSIALEIACEEQGESFFRNGALPLVIFKYLEGFSGFKDQQDEDKFVTDFQEMFSGKKKFRAMLLPKGIGQDDPVDVENNKAQFLETRKHQRTVIAGALGVPPHLVGDLERGTFNNVEQQDNDFTLNVILPIARKFEAAMERDLLTQKDRDAGFIIRFNMDSTLRADFKSRQEGLKIQREMGVINPDEWREVENMNPRKEGGDAYWDQGPSGQGTTDE